MSGEAEEQGSATVAVAAAVRLADNIGSRRRSSDNRRTQRRGQIRSTGHTARCSRLRLRLQGFLVLMGWLSQGRANAGAGFHIQRRNLLRSYRGGSHDFRSHHHNHHAGGGYP